MKATGCRMEHETSARSPVIPQACEEAIESLREFHVNGLFHGLAA
jgi:hypothetical protein